jgi:arthrofactin-type cyclic lipopeptide synthetase C
MLLPVTICQPKRASNKMSAPEGHILNPQVTESSCDDGDEYLPASFAQQRLWFLAQIEGVSEAYHVPMRLRLRGHLNHAALRWALDRIQRRHEVLRTTFATRDGELYQRISPAEDSRFTLLEYDLRQHPSAEEELRRLAEHEVSIIFDLEHGPLIRGRLVRLSDDEHVLFLTMHHIASDGWSMGILRKELSVLYAAFLRGEDDPLPALEIQYADYAVWQREWLTGERLEQQAEYWKGALAGAPALLELPTDHPRPAQQDYKGAFAELQLDAALTAGLRDLSRRHKSTLYMTLMAGWALVLSRLSGQTDVVIGTPVANRRKVEIENLIGLFVNSLAVRIDLSASPTAKLLLEQVKRQVLEAQQRQDIPFEQVVEIVRPARSLAHSPLFQVMFVWNNTPAEVLTLPGLELQLLSSPSDVAKFDLALSLQETAETIVGGIAYATSLFEPQTVERYIGYFRTVLEAMVADDTLMVEHLPLLSASERHQLLYAWNATQAEFPADQCVHELFEAQVAKSPDAIAVIFEDQKLSYAELNRRANRLAHYLRERGVGPDLRVAICLERSLEMVVALLAVLKAGGAYVPLDPTYPAERLGFMIHDAGPIALLTQQHLQPLLPELDPKLPIINMSESSGWAQMPDTNPNPRVIGLTPQHLAYVIYTSGSTGRPKGVLIEHGALAPHCVECREFYALTPEDRVLQFASPSFDPAIEQILPPLLSGARVVLRTALIWTPDEFQKKISEFGLTVINLPPAYWQKLTEEWASAVKPFSAHSLRLVIIGGDAMSVQTLRLWQQTPFNSARLLNAYGPTETVITATSFEIPALDPGQQPLERLPIGRPRGARRIYVLDRWGQPVPTGVAGELHIGGTALARGYHNRADLTAEKFIADPFSKSAGARLYRTGDLVRYMPDGNLEFLGRVDQQVKIHGFRIELGEIEVRLLEYAAIRESVVIAREDVPGDKHLVAYYITFDHEPVDPEELRSHLAAALPEHMVPAAYVRLDVLPLTPSGKLDRKALPSPDDEAYARAAYEAPKGEIEIALAAIWSGLLGVERISRHDNFFNLGGHSFLALRVISEIHKTLAGHVSVPAFFLRPTIAGLAKELAHGHHPKPQVATLRAGTAGLPIYFMGARPEEFRVAQLIGGDRRIFTVDVPILTSWLAAFEAAKLDALPTIEQLGMLYGEILAEHVGSAPCVIAGYSLGGKIALDAARALERAGGNVAFVLLLDARASTSSSYTLGPALESLAWIWRGAGTKQAGDASPLHRLGTSLSESWTVARWLMSRMPNSVKHRVDLIRGRFGQVTQSSVRNSLPSGYFDEEGKPVDNLLFNRFAMLLGRLWRPRPVDAVGVLIRADNSENNLPGRDPTGGWGGLFTRGFEIVQTAGDHHTMVTEEHAASLARQMNLILDKYEAAQTAQGGMLGSNPDQCAAADGQRRLGPAPAHAERSVA